MKRLFAVFMTVLLLFTMTACGGSGETASETETGNDNPYAGIKIALVSQTIGTEQFILQAYNAFMEAVEKYGFQAISIECLTLLTGQRKRELPVLRVMI